MICGGTVPAHLKSLSKTAAALVGATAVVWATVAAVASYYSDMQAARTRIDGSELRDTACGQIEYAILGSGHPTLVSHGSGGGFDQGLDFGRRLAGRGIQLIAVSRFGYLRSPLPEDPSAERQADAYACLLDSLSLERASIVGASAGAPSALQFAIRHPGRVAKVVLHVPAVYAPKPPGAPALDIPKGVPAVFDTLLRSDFLFWAASKIAFRTIVRTILATPVERFDEAEPPEQERVRAMIDHILPVSARRLGLLNDGLIVGSLGRYDLEKIAAPSLLISARDDLYGTFAAARYSADALPGATFVGFEQGGHAWIGHDDEVMRIVGDFLTAEGGNFSTAR